MLLMAAAWPLTLTAYIGAIAVLVIRSWKQRKKRNIVQTTIACAALQVLLPILGMTIARITWRPAIGDNFSVDPREALIVTATLALMVASFIVGVTVGRKQLSQQGAEPYKKIRGGFF